MSLHNPCYLLGFSFFDVLKNFAVKVDDALMIA
jgi:hypothetical protein